MDDKDVRTLRKQTLLQQVQIGQLFAENGELKLRELEREEAEEAAKADAE